MKEMIKHLKSKKFEEKIKNVQNSDIKYIVSDINEFGEAEKKIIDFINKSKISKNLTIYSPDADMILLAMLLKNIDNIKILRLDQQLTEKNNNKNLFHVIYNLIDIDNLEKVILNHLKKCKKKY